MAAIVYIIIQTRMSNCKFWNFVHQFCFAFCSFSISQPLAKFIGTATKLSVQCTHALNTTADNVLYTFVCCSCLYCRQNKSENWRRITLTRICFVSIVLLSSLPANPFLNEKKNMNNFISKTVAKWVRIFNVTMFDTSLRHGYELIGVTIYSLTLYLGPLAVLISVPYILVMNIFD